VTRATTTISARGRVLEATARADLQPAVEALLQRFADLGDRWAAGLVVWSSWAPIVMEERGDGFVLRSPDFERDARDDRTDDLTIALETTEGIVRVLNAARAIPEDVRFDQTVEAVRGWEEHRELVLSRAPGRDARDSGWFLDLGGIARAEPWSADDVVDVPVWGVRMARPAVARALALPVGVGASVVGESVELVVDERDGAILARGPL
jgi:hypothetical protein